MKSRINILFITLIVLSVCSCSPQGDGAVSIVEINGNKMFVASLNGLSPNVVTIPLSSLVESMELVQLETTDDAFFRHWFTTITENYIGVRQPEWRPFLLFSRSGRFLGSSSVGQGLGEHSWTLYDDVFDEENGFIYLAPFAHSDRILVLDTSGAFIREITTPMRLNKPRLFVYGDVLSIVHKSFSEDSPMAFQIDINTGQLLSELATPAHFVVQSFCGEIFHTRNVEGVFDFFYTSYTGVDTLFHFDLENNRIVPFFTMTSATGIWTSYFQVNRDLIMTHVNVRDEHGIYINRGIVATDLRNLTSSYVNVVNDFFGNLPVTPSAVTFRNGYFVHNVQPEDLMYEIENHLARGSVSQSDRQQLEELLSKLEEDTNNVVFIGRLRDGIDGKLW